MPSTPDLCGGLVGPVLKMGSEGDRILYLLGALCRLPACPCHGRVARSQCRVDQYPGPGHDNLQPVFHQPGRLRPALLRRPELNPDSSTLCRTPPDPLGKYRKLLSHDSKD